jgi:hypothetical protein
MQKMIRMLLSALVVLSMAACKAPPAGPPQIHALPKLTSVQKITLPSGQAASIVEEYFIVENPPHEQQAFLRLIQQYNQQTVSAAKIKQQLTLLRLFYRATEKLQASYQEKNQGYFDKERIENHGDDLLMIVKYQQDALEARYEFETDKAAFKEVFGPQK